MACCIILSLSTVSAVPSYSSQAWNVSSVCLLHTRPMQNTPSNTVMI